MSRRGFYEFGTPVNPDEFPAPIANLIKDGTLIKASDGLNSSGMAFDCFYVKGAFGANITLYRGGGYDSFLEGRDEDKIPDPEALSAFKDFVYNIGRDLGVNAYV